VTVRIANEVGEMHLNTPGFPSFASGDQDYQTSRSPSPCCPPLRPHHSAARDPDRHRISPLRSMRTYPHREVGEEEMRGEKSLERCEEDGRGEIQRYVRDEGSDYCCYRAGFTRISVLERKRPVSRIFEGPGNAVESTSRRFRVL